MLTSEEDGKTGQKLKGFIYYENVPGCRIVSEYDSNTNTRVRDGKELKGAYPQEVNGETYLFGAKMNGSIEFDDGQKLSYSNGKLDRKDGPAIEFAMAIKSGIATGNGNRPNTPTATSNGHRTAKPTLCRRLGGRQPLHGD